MSTQAPTADVAPDAAAAPAAGPGKKLIMIGAAAGLALGFVVGGFVIAPRLGHAEGEAEVVAEESHEPAESTGPQLVHQIENLVVNPANTNGSRFLMVTTSIVVKDAASLEELVARDAEIRDRIVDFLSSQSIESLGDPTRRETLKSDLAASIGALFPEGVVKRVLLPQFVIQ